MTRETIMKRQILLALTCTIAIHARLFAQPATEPSTRPVPQHADIAAPKPGGRAAPIQPQFAQKHESFVARAKQGNIDLLFEGDSITEGWGTRGKEVWDKYYGNLNAANFGIGGDQTQHVLWRIENGELENISPKVCVLMIGTNNTSTNPPEEVAHGVELIVKTIRTKLPNTKVLLLAIFPRNRHANEQMRANEEIRMQEINQINPMLAKLDDGRMVRYLNINAKFLAEDGKVHEEIMVDLLHPTAKGYVIWAEAMKPLLDEMMK
jgi:lysophospholipase L1-like esterase